MNELLSSADILAEAQQALEQYWFLHSIEISERTDQTISIRLFIRINLFVHAFVGELSGSLYLALIEHNRRVYGIDLEGGNWHEHPYGNAHKHRRLEERLEPFPLLKFLSQVEKILLENNMLL